MKRSVQISLFLALFVSIAFSSASIFSPIGFYYMGDNVALIGYVQAEQDCEGVVTILLDNETLYTTTYNFTQNSVVSFDTIFSQTTINAGPEDHLLTVSSNCFESTETQFYVSDMLNLLYELNSDKFILGDALELSVVAYRGGEKLENITEIMLNTYLFVDSAYFEFEELGAYILSLVAEDEHGNHAELSIPLTVSDKLIVETTLEKTSYKPAENIVINAMIQDEFGNLRSGTIGVHLFGGVNHFDTDENGFMSAEIPIPENKDYGEYELKISARRGENYGEQSFLIDVERIVYTLKIEVEDEIVKHEQTQKIKVLGFDQRAEIFGENEIMVSIYDSDNRQVAETPAIINGAAAEFFIDLELREGEYIARAAINDKEFDANFFVRGEDTGITGFAIGGDLLIPLVIGVIIVCLFVMYKIGLFKKAKDKIKKK